MYGFSRRYHVWVAPSVVSIVAEGAYGTSTNPHEEESSPFVHPKKRGGGPRILIRQILAPEL